MHLTDQTQLFPLVERSCDQTYHFDYHIDHFDHHIRHFDHHLDHSLNGLVIRHITLTIISSLWSSSWSLVEGSCDQTYHFNHNTDHSDYFDHHIDHFDEKSKFINKRCSLKKTDKSSWNSELVLVSQSALSSFSAQSAKQTWSMNHGTPPTIKSDTGKSSSKVWIGLTVPLYLRRVGLLCW